MASNRESESFYPPVPILRNMLSDSVYEALLNATESEQLGPDLLDPDARMRALVAIHLEERWQEAIWESKCVPERTYVPTGVIQSVDPLLIKRLEFAIAVGDDEMLDSLTKDCTMPSVDTNLNDNKQQETLHLMLVLLHPASGRSSARRVPSACG